MKDKMIEELKRKYSANDDRILLHEVFTTDDIFCSQKDSHSSQIKRKQPDKIYIALRVVCCQSLCLNWRIYKALYCLHIKDIWFISNHIKPMFPLKKMRKHF